MKIPGRLDGQRYDDLRQLMPQAVIDHYTKAGQWDNITKVAFPVSPRDLVTVTVSNTRRDHWARDGQPKGWNIYKTSQVFS